MITNENDTAERALQWKLRRNVLRVLLQEQLENFDRRHLAIASMVREAQRLNLP